MMHAFQALALLFALAATPAPAADWKIATIATAPWASYDAGGRPVGAFPELMAELERRTGKRIEMAFLPFARLFLELEAGTQDCTFVYDSAETSVYLVKGEPFHAMPYGVVPRRGLALAAYDDLRPLSIAVPRGHQVTPRFAQDAQLSKHAVTDYQAGLQMVMRGHVDAVAGAIPTIRHLAEAGDMADRIGTPLVLATLPNYLKCSKRSPRVDAMGELNEGIRKLRGDGTLERVLGQYGYPVAPEER
jgi:polar amino acid transport system substrate-binding protein